ncbi:MAG: MBL fold metallo-hydrolase [Patescibacteria group bacterium]
MEIKYIAHSSFIIKTKNATVVTDPYAPSIGVKFPRTEADIVTISHDHSDHNNLKALDGSPTVFDWPGEYEVKNVAVIGIQTFHDDEKGAKRGVNVMYKFTTEGLNILHCGDLGHTLDDKTIEAIGPVDILMIPVGGVYTIDAEKAVAVARRVDPYIIIPMHFASPKLDQKTFGELDPVEAFVQAFGGNAPEKMPKLNVKREDVITETATKIVLLEPTA